MKKIIKFLTLLVMISGLVVLASCGPEETTPSTPENPNTPSTPEDPNKPSTPDNPNTPTDPDKETYTVTVKATSGKPLNDFIVTVSNPLDANFKSVSKLTSGKGVASFNLDPASYRVSITALPGYYFDDDATSYTGTISSTNKDLSVTCTTKLIEGEDPESGYVYTMGSPAYDFTITTVEDKTWNLAEELGKHKLVVLNFWYTTCSACLTEFPYLTSAYEEYKDKISLIGINNYPDDDKQSIINFNNSYALPFDLAYDSTGVAAPYGLTAYPTTVFIDRYGTVDFIEVGSITSKDKWTKLFDMYLGDDYVPTYKGTGEPGEDAIIPDVEMSNPEDIANLINAEGFNGTYHNVSGEDEKYNWPWIIDQESGSIIPSNSSVDNSYSIFELKVSMKKDQVLAFDYRCAVDESDYLYVLEDEKIIYEMTGFYNDYKTCYLFVADEDKEYTFSFCYIKDNILSDDVDKVFIKNVRFQEISDIDVFTYIIREAAYGTRILNSQWTNYRDVVFNQEDGYYHVGTVNGPLLFADLLSATHFDNATIYSYFTDEKFLTGDGAELAQYQDAIEAYGSYATNSLVVGYTPVTEDLKQILEAVNKCVGAAPNNTKAWLEMCVYFDVYGPLEGNELINQETKQIADPIVGLAPFNSYTVVEDDAATTDVEATSLDYQRVVSTRGFLFKFVPTQTGVYNIHSNLKDSITQCLVYDENMKYYAENDGNLKYYTYGTGYGDLNFYTYAYFEKGKTYYIRPYFEDIYETGMMSFVTEYVGESIDVLTKCSEWPFTTDTDFNDGTSTDSIENHLITVGIDAELGADGFYHEKLADGSLSEQFVYVDFTTITDFGFSLKDMIAKTAFDFTVTELGSPAFDSEGYLVFDYYEVDEDGNISEEPIAKRYTDKDGNPIMKSEYHVDMTNRITEIYNEKVIQTEGELKGCIAVNEELAQILQLLMDKYTFRGVANSWQKLCYYYKHVAAPVVE